MDLRDHLKEAGEAVDDFADRIGEAVTTIRKIAYRQRQPSLSLALKISAATGGAVQPAYLALLGVNAAPAPSPDAQAEAA